MFSFYSNIIADCSLKINKLFILEALERNKQFADKAHGAQKRKYSGQRYMGHPVGVMHICKEYTDDLAVLSAALLHDVLEDIELSPEQL